MHFCGLATLYPFLFLLYLADFARSNSKETAELIVVLFVIPSSNAWTVVCEVRCDLCVIREYIHGCYEKRREQGEALFLVLSVISTVIN